MIKETYKKHGDGRKISYRQSIGDEEKYFTEDYLHLIKVPKSYKGEKNQLSQENKVLKDGLLGIEVCIVDIRKVKIIGVNNIIKSTGNTDKDILDYARLHQYNTFDPFFAVPPLITDLDEPDGEKTLVVLGGYKRTGGLEHYIHENPDGNPYIVCLKFTFKESLKDKCMSILNMLENQDNSVNIISKQTSTLQDTGLYFKNYLIKNYPDVDIETASDEKLREVCKESGINNDTFTYVEVINLAKKLSDIKIPVPWTKDRILNYVKDLSQSVKAKLKFVVHIFTPNVGHISKKDIFPKHIDAILELATGKVDKVKYTIQYTGISAKKQKENVVKFTRDIFKVIEKLQKIIDYGIELNSKGEKLSDKFEYNVFDSSKEQKLTMVKKNDNE